MRVALVGLLAFYISIFVIPIDAWVVNPSGLARKSGFVPKLQEADVSGNVGVTEATVGTTFMPEMIIGNKEFSSTPTRTRPKRKVDKDTTKKDETIPEKGFAVKETRSIADEIEEYFQEDNYLVILYNDPFNKRAYVSGVLQQVFKWDDMQADAVMMQAHTYGYAVAVETSKEKAEKYVKQLLEKGLIAEARKSGDPEPSEQ